MPTVGKDAPPPPLLMGRYQTVKQLGKGSFGKVYQARNVETGEEVAIKVMDKAHLANSGAEQEHIEREIGIMRRVRHPNVVCIHDVMGSKKRIYVVMELVRGGSLLDYLAPPGRGIGEPAARRVFHQLVSALEYCHSHGVYHRDIKPENVLVDDNGDIKVADFGLSALADTKRKEALLLHTVCGTPMYIAPEVLTRRGYDGAVADVWACGVVLFLLVAGRLPFGNRSDNSILSLYRMICRGEYRCPPSFSPNLVRLIRRLLCPDPARRITIPQIKQTAWFRRGFKEINFYIGNDERPRSLDEYAQRDLFDSDTDDDDSTDVSATSSEDPSSPVAAAHHRGSCMHTSVSAPALTSLQVKNAAGQVQPRMRRPKSLNAFDIIASSPSLDLSGLFDEPGEQVRFLSAAPVPKIISKLEEIAGHVRFTARTKDHQVSIEATRNGRRGALLISARIFELTPELVMVKVCKKAGDNAEYRQFCDNELKPRLHGLVRTEDGVGAAR